MNNDIFWVVGFLVTSIAIGVYALFITENISVMVFMLVLSFAEAYFAYAIYRNMEKKHDLL